MFRLERDSMKIVAYQQETVQRKRDVSRNFKWLSIFGLAYPINNSTIKSFVWSRIMIFPFFELQHYIFYCGFFIILSCGFLLQNNVANCQNYTFQARNWNYFLNNLSDKGLKGIFKPKQWIKAKHLKLYQQYGIVKQFIKFYYPLNNIWEPAWNVIQRRSKNLLKNHLLGSKSNVFCLIWQPSNFY